MIAKSAGDVVDLGNLLSDGPDGATALKPEPIDELTTRYFEESDNRLGPTEGLHLDEALKRLCADP